MAEIKGIDVSYHNGAVNWRKVANTGVQFAIIRACYGWDNDKQIDKQLAANVAGCEAQGIPYGFYHYSYAESAEDARKEARFFLRVIKDYKPTYPVYFDFEENFQLAYTPEKQLQIIEAFLAEVEAAGYFAGLYMSASPLQKLYNYAPARGKKFSTWVAHIGVNKPNYSGPYAMWQYSWVGKVDGSSADTDMNIAYIDFPAIIKRNGLNGWADAGEAEAPEVETVPFEKYNALQAKYDALRTKVENFIKDIENGKE